MADDRFIPIADVQATSYTIPTDAPESDGTITWNHTSLVVATVSAGDQIGLGYTYCHSAAVRLIATVLAPVLEDRDALALEENWSAMNVAVRNIGRPGIAACAISALDIACWDLKARLLDVCLPKLLPMARQSVPVYGSGGFTSYDQARLLEQLASWAEQGCSWVKMKIGRQPDQDSKRVAAAAGAIGPAALFVDANGAYRVKQALDFAAAFAASGVIWFEEPVSSNDHAGLALMRERAPAGMAITAGEYGYDPGYFRAMLEDKCVDILQADATRCGGITGFLRAAALCDGFEIPLSSHCAPSIHLAPACAAPRLEHMEWFHDHVRIEQMLFDGAPQLKNGHIAPDLSRKGHGLVFRKADAARYRDPS